MRSLTDIAMECDTLARQSSERIRKSFGTDKASHGFAAFYEECVGHLREKPCRILEVGVRSGGSIRMWERGFPHAKVVGIDHDLNICALKPERATLLQFDITAPGAVDGIGKKYGPFDFVIDDAAHTKECSSAVLRFFPQYIVPGGWLFIEDTHCKGQAEWCKQLVDAVNHHGALRSCGRANWKEPRSEFDREIHQVVFRPGIAGIQRYKP